ncbi:MAG: insulinase family protein [Muribaculaceae bacterium]|nr:insulinase family protein [Muribaculaceae bacterium]
MKNIQPNSPFPVQTYTLSNGIRAVCRRTPGAVSYIGVVIAAGSRDEEDHRFGLAHFVEHTIFKGTRRRRSWHISNRMESIGGELNAYTSKEETVVYTNAPVGYASRAVELLADVISESVFPDAEVEREREVVTEEINSYLDSPGEAVYDEFEELIYAGSGLAHNILGTPESVHSLTPADCSDFLSTRYTPSRMVIYVSDPGDPDRMVRLLEQHFGSLERRTMPREFTVPPVVEPFDEVHDHGGHQAHTIVGARTFGRLDPRRHALLLLNNYLGGPCMNSRLNQELREQRGLVYTVDSNVALMSDTGLFSIYFGSDPANVGRCCRLIARELDRLASHRLTERTFESVKRQYCGQLLVGSDHRESAAMSMGKSLMYFGEVHSVADTARRVREVTAEQMREVAEMLSPSLCSTLTLR